MKSVFGVIQLVRVAHRQVLQYFFIGLFLFIFQLLIWEIDSSLNDWWVPLTVIGYLHWHNRSAVAWWYSIVFGILFTGILGTPIVLLLYLFGSFSASQLVTNYLGTKSEFALLLLLTIIQSFAVILSCLPLGVWFNRVCGDGPSLQAFFAIPIAIVFLTMVIRRTNYV
ncbi:MAG: hypothetical protein AAB833_02720 [Patescibacteria group bacterium]